MKDISLAAARVNKELTLDEASKLLEIGRCTLFNYEKGKTVPKSTTLFKMAELYGCDVEEFRL